LVNNWIIKYFLDIFSTFSRCIYEIWWLQRRNVLLYINVECVAEWRNGLAISR